MTKRGAKLGAAALAIALSGVMGSAFLSADEATWTREEAERFLRKAKVAAIDKDSEPGRTLPWLVTLERDGVRAQGQFKRIHRPRPSPLPDCFDYEIAAYELSKLLGLDIVPPVIERTIDGSRGSLQLHVEDCWTEHDRVRAGAEPPDQEAFLRRTDEVRVFELLVADECGDADDTLIHKETWKLCRVDFSEAFAPDPIPAEDCPLERCSRRLYDRLLRTTSSALEKTLKPYLNESEIHSISERKKWIVARLQELIRTRGEKAVLFEEKAASNRPSGD